MAQGRNRDAQQGALPQLEPDAGGSRDDDGLSLDLIAASHGAHERRISGAGRPDYQAPRRVCGSKRGSLVITEVSTNSNWFIGSVCNWVMVAPSQRALGSPCT